MALTRPILYSQPAFDIQDGKVFTFNVIGGDQVVANRLVITDQSNNTTVYNKKETTYSFSHTLSAEDATSMHNGKYYSAVLYTYNALDEQSISSAPIQFYCYSTPIFEFNNVSSSDVINSSSYEFVLDYSQNEGEILNSYSISLYDNQRSMMATSGNKYVASSARLAYTFGGLEDGRSYYVRAVGLTAQNTQLDTGYIPFIASYSQPDTFSIIDLSMDCAGGYVLVQSRMSAINGSSYPVPPVYVDNNTAVQVTNRNNYVGWDSGYRISGDFTASLWGKNFSPYSDIIKMGNTQGDTLVIKCMKVESSSNQYYASLEVVDNGITYYICSDIVRRTQSDPVQIWFRRVGNLYEIEMHSI